MDVHQDKGREFRNSRGWDLQLREFERPTRPLFYQQLTIITVAAHGTP